MTTRRLDREDAYLTCFRSVVDRVETTPDGVRVALAATAFYPEGGGQPADRGRLGGRPVRDVQEDGQGVVWHHLDTPPDEPEPEGQVDWPRRFDHMQQHTGQHLLSAAFAQLFQFRTIGFHLGAEDCTIDLDTPRLDTDRLREAVRRANEAVWADLPVVAGVHERQSVDALGLRKPTERDGPIRVVDVEGVDRSACGGTHVHRTGEVGVILDTRLDRMRGQVRVHFVCGGRVPPVWSRAQTVLARLTELTTTGVEELPGRVERLLETVRLREREVGRLKSQLLADRVPGLLAAGTRADGQVLVELVVEEGAEAVRLLGQKLVATEPRVALVLGARADGVLLIGRGGALAVDVRPLADALRARFGVKGGGRPEWVQLGGLTGVALDEAAVLARAWWGERFGS